MSDATPLPAAEPVIERRQGLSLVWIIPLVAALIGAWLAYRTLSEQGPAVTIVFRDGAGLEAGKTRIRYKSVQVGEVESIGLSPDLASVQVHARLSKPMSAHLREGTRFWVVRPRIGLAGVSGLGTLVSGAYIEMEPGQGERTRQFTGLDEPPVVRADAPGRRYVLEAERLGSLSVGAPVYYREIPVGQVLGHELVSERGLVQVHIYVQAPYDRLVRANSRFWNVSGVDFSIGANGVNLRTGALHALFTGGVAFDSPRTGEGSERTSEGGARFTLYESFASVAEASLTRKIRYAVYFDGSVRGLSVGAPVEFRGIKVGTVADVRMELHTEDMSVRIPVVVEIEPQRVTAVGDVRRITDAEAIIEALVDRGLRARLRTGSLLTGQLFVDIDLYPDAEPAVIESDGRHPVIPTVPSTLDKFASTANSVMNRLRGLPLEQLMEELVGAAGGANRLLNAPETRGSLRALEQTLGEYRALASRVEGEVGPLAERMGEASSAARDALQAAAPDSELRYELTATLREVKAAARSMRTLTDYLERHPEALLKGKGRAGR